MDQIENLISANDLHTSKWASAIQRREYTLDHLYEEQVDKFRLLLVSPETLTYTYYLDDHIGLLFIPDNGEIVGLRVNSLRRSFIEKYIYLKQFDIGSSSFAKEISKITSDVAEKHGLILPKP
jgi:hypothetical protein